MNKFLGWILLLITSCFAESAFGQTQTIFNGGLRFNGNVYTQVNQSGVSYFGGDFTQIQSKSGPLARLNLSTVKLEVNSVFTNISGTVKKVVADGAGGLYIGGTFTYTSGSTTLFNLIRVSSANLVSGVGNNNNSGGVNDLILVGNKLYVLKSNAVVCLNTSNNQYESWSIFGDARCAIFSNNKLYIGGKFQINGNNQAIIRFNTITQTLDFWDPMIRNSSNLSNINTAVVNAMAISGGIIYYGGSNILFASGIAKKNFGALNASDGSQNTLTTAVTGSSVNAIAVVGNNLFIGGIFTGIQSSPTSTNYPRSNLGLVNLAGQVNVNWNPLPNGPIYALSIVGSQLMVGGNFTTIQSQAISNLALYNSPGALSPLLQINAPVSTNSIVYFGGMVGSNAMIGGSFNYVQYASTKGIAAINSTSGLPQTFNAQLSNGGSVRAIHMVGSTMFIGGIFSNVNGVPRSNFAAITNIGNLIMSTNLSFSGTVRSITSLGSDIFVGGDFTSVNNVIIASQLQRNYLVKIKTATTQPTIDATFNGNIIAPNNVLAVNTVKIINGNLFVGGNFTSPRIKIAKLSTLNGSNFTTFDAKIINGTSNVIVNDIISVNSTQIAIGGSFGQGFNQNVYSPLLNANLGANFLGGLAVVNESNGSLIARNQNSGPVNALLKQFNNSIEYADLNGIRSFSLTNFSTSTIAQTNPSCLSISYVNNLYVYSGSFSNTIPSSNFSYVGTVAYTPPAAPTIAANSFFVSNRTMTSMRINWSNGNGSRRMVIARANGYPSSLPIDGSQYTAGPYGLGTFLGGGYVVYDGSGNFADITNLSPITTYYFRIIEYNGTGINTMYASNFLQATGTTLDLLAPSISANGINFPSVGQNNLTVKWNRGDGNYCMVVAKQSSAVDYVPQANANTSANSGFGLAPLANGNCCLYRGPGNSVNVSNLNPGQTYHFAVYEFNQFNQLIRYRTINPAIGNQTTTAMATPPTIAPSGISFSNLSSSSMQVNWSNNGDGNNRLVLAIQGDFLPNEIFAVNGTSYTANANFSGTSPLASPITVRGTLNGTFGNYSAKVVYNGTGNNIQVTGLLGNTLYTYMVVGYNTIGNINSSAAYLTSSVLTGSKRTDANIQAPSISASNPTSIENHNAMKLKWTNGNGNNRMVVMRQGLPVSFTPSANVTYSANENFSMGTDLGSGQKVVYNGNVGNSVNISGLIPYTNYHISIYEYNSAYNANTSSWEIAYKLTNVCTYTAKTAPANWPRVAGGAESDASGSIAVDASGNVYVTGTVRGNVNFGITELSANANDIFLSKYTSTGELLWVKLAGGVGDDASAAVMLDNNNNAYIVGSFRNTATFDTIILSSAGSDDGFIAKYSPSGNVIWAKSFGSTGQDVANSLAMDGNGNLLIGGFHSGITSFSGSSNTITTNGNSDLLIAKYTQSGAFVWARGGGSTGYDFAFGIGTDQNNNVYACGEIKGVASFGTVNSTYAAGADAILVKFDASGSPQYANSYGSKGDDKGMFLDVDANGNVYLVGAFSDTVNFGSNSLISSGITDGFLAKITGANGSVQWVKKQGGVSQDITSGVDIGTNGEIYVTGGFGGTCSFDAQTLTSLGNIDIFVAIYSATGILNVARRFGGPLDDAARGIYAIIPNNTYISGYFNSTASFGGFDVNTKIQPLPPNGNWDLFVHNIGNTFNSDPSADLVSWHKFNGNTIDFSGNGYNGTLFSPGSPNTVVATTDRYNTNASAYSFNGTGRIDFNIPNNANFDNLNEITVMAWVKVGSFSGPGNLVDRGIIGSNAATGMSFTLQLTQFQGLFGQIIDNTNSSIGIAASPNTVYTANTWAHVALTYENGIQTRIYLNGSVVGTSGAFAGNKTVDLSNKQYTIGAIGSSSTGPFVNNYSMNGSIDDVRIYKRALSSVQIQDIMLAASNASAPPPQENSTSKILGTEKANVWPNPSNGTITVELLNEVEQTIDFAVIDLSGKIVYQASGELFEMGMVKKSIDLSGTPAGFYTLQIIKGGEVQNHKLIINN